MTPATYLELLTKAGELLLESKSAVALTGAGISTPSGIPDFRSTDSGLWQNHDPMDVASLSTFRYRPQVFFDWVRPLARGILEAEPNPAHLALAALESRGLLRGIITQNIDDLHRRAGSHTVLELHGHLRQATCVSCYRRFPSGDLLAEFAATGRIPHCEVCGGILKPDVVLYGEQLPYLVVQEARALIDQSDLVLVVGSSLEVTPAAVLPVQALNQGARLIIINHDPTYLDERAELVFRQDVARVLSDLAEEVLREHA